MGNEQIVWTVLGALAATLLVLSRDILAPMIRARFGMDRRASAPRNGNCGLSREERLMMDRISNGVHQLEQWHAPDQNGEQHWKGTSLHREVCGLRGDVNALSKANSEGFARLEEAIRDLSRDIRSSRA